MDNKIILTEETSVLNTLKIENGISLIKNEFQNLIEFSKNLEIKDFEDKKQIEVIKSSKNGYVKTRNTIKRAFKSKRDINTEENRINIKAEKEVLEEMVQEEKRLGEMIEKAELEKLKKDNIEKLEDRKEALKKCDYIETDENLLIIKDKEFENLLTEKRIEFVEKEEKRLEEEKEKIAREKEIEEAKKQAKIEAEKEAEKKAKLEKEKVEQEKKEAEEKRLADLEKARIDKENEIARIKQEQIDKENAEKKRIEEEKQAKIEADKKKKEEQELMGKRKEFIKYRDSLDFDHFEDKDGKRIFYKKVGEFKI